ncbi:MAG: hypothetical protein AABZ80_08565 [Gemmatimonadota bacterium]
MTSIKKTARMAGLLYVVMAAILSGADFLSVFPKPQLEAISLCRGSSAC